MQHFLKIFYYMCTNILLLFLFLLSLSLFRWYYCYINTVYVTMLEFQVKIIEMVVSTSPYLTIITYQIFNINFRDSTVITKHYKKGLYVWTQRWLQRIKTLLQLNAFPMEWSLNNHSYNCTIYLLYSLYHWLFSLLYIRVSFFNVFYIIEISTYTHNCNNR